MNPPHPAPHTVCAPSEGRGIILLFNRVMQRSLRSTKGSLVISLESLDLPLRGTKAMDEYHARASLAKTASGITRFCYDRDDGLISFIVKPLKEEGLFPYPGPLP